MTFFPFQSLDIKLYLVLFQSLLKGSSESGEAVQIKKKGASKGRPLKRVKIAGNAIDIKEKSLLKPVKGPYPSCIIYFNSNAI